MLHKYIRAFFSAFAPGGFFAPGLGALGIGAIAGANVLGGLLGAKASKDAAGMQADATRYGVDVQNNQFQQTRNDMMPWLDEGRSALYRLSDMTKPGGEFMQRYTGADLASDPGYQFGLNQGRAAVDQSAAGRGVLFSGKTLKDLMQFGTDYGGTKFNEGFQRDMAGKQFRQGALAGLSGTGQATGVQMGQLGANTSNSIADLIASGGAARAAGIVGSANALTSGLSNAGNSYMQMSMLDRIMGAGGGGGGSGGYGSGALANMDAYSNMAGYGR